jgi:hypothetical protein
MKYITRKEKRKIESMKAEGEYKLNLLNEKGNIKVKKIELNNERKKDENNHKKDMTIIEKNHKRYKTYE